MTSHLAVKETLEEIANLINGLDKKKCSQSVKIKVMLCFFA
jgi:hypothetical protein